MAAVLIALSVTRAPPPCLWSRKHVGAAAVADVARAHGFLHARAGDFPVDQTVAEGSAIGCRRALHRMRGPAAVGGAAAERLSGRPGAAALGRSAVARVECRELVFAHG